MTGVFQFAHTWGVLTTTPTADSDTLRRVLTGSHRAVFEARILPDFTDGDDPDGVEVDILAGRVRMDGAAKIQRSLDLTVTGRFPRRIGDLLLPDGTEVWVRRGIDIGDDVLWFPLGFFRIDDADQADAPHGPIRLTGYDRMAGIIDNELVNPRAFEAGRSYGSVFRELVADVYPAAVVVFDDIDLDLAPIGRQIIVERSRYEALRNLAAGRGKIVHWDSVGQLLVRSTPDPDEPVWEARSGRGGVVTTVQQHVTRRDVINAVVVRSQGQDALSPARAVALDDGPRSPTRAHADGRFGVVPAFETTPAAAGGPQVAQAAADILRRAAGMPYRVEFGAVPNPALQPYDPIRVTLRDGQRERHVLQRLEIPLTAAEQMTAAAMEQRNTRVRVVVQ